MSHKADRKTRGRSAVSGGAWHLGGGDAGPRPTKPNVPAVLHVETSRPVTAGVRHRGDRRDTSKSYTGNDRHPARGNTPRIDLKTRSR